MKVITLSIIINKNHAKNLYFIVKFQKLVDQPCLIFIDGFFKVNKIRLPSRSRMSRQIVHDFLQISEILSHLTVVASDVGTILKFRNIF